MSVCVCVCVRAMLQTELGGLSGLDDLDNDLLGGMGPLGMPSAGVPAAAAHVDDPFHVADGYDDVVLSPTPRTARGASGGVGFGAMETVDPVGVGALHGGADLDDLVGLSRPW